MSDRCGLHIGIDGGGSSTTGVLCLLRRIPGSIIPLISVLRRSTSGPANWLGSVDSNLRMTNSLRKALKPLLQHADRPLTSVTVALAGLGLKGRSRAAKQTLKDLVGDAANCRVISDTWAAHGAGGAFADGVTVISGTGSVAVTRQAGRWLSVGGHGFILGDEGSGFWIGQQGLQAAVRADEGRGPATVLMETAKQHFNLHSLKQLPAKIHSAEHAVAVGRISGFCPLVLSAADDENDAVARKIVKRAGYHLAELAVTLAKRAVRRGAEKDQLSIFAVGGVWQGSVLLWEELKKHFCQCGYCGAEIASPIYSPAEGAVLATYLADKEFTAG